MQQPALSQTAGQTNGAISHKRSDLQYPAGPQHTADHLEEPALEMPAEHMRLGMMCIRIFGYLPQQPGFRGRIPFCIRLCQWMDYVHIKGFGKDTAISLKIGL